MNKNYYIFTIIILVIALGFLWIKFDQKCGVVEESTIEETEVVKGLTTEEAVNEIKTVGESIKLEGEGYEEFLIGAWKSADDEKNIFVIKQGGIIENIYNDNLVDSGVWTTEGFRLKTVINEEEFEYTVMFAGIERLELSYLPRGNTLNFVRVVE